MAFHEPGQFPFTKVLEQNWRAIYEEYEAIAGDVTDWFEKDLYGEGWKVFGLFDFPHGKPIDQNIKRCPLTTSVVQNHIPNHGAIGFSILKPMTRIRPHQGLPGNYLRCHLGLRVPKGECGLKVSNEIRKWEVGKVQVFDDRVVHEAWNLTTEERVVLLLDFVPAPDVPR